jgi:tetratricopeptide (TPR) repeat protein
MYDKTFVYVSRAIRANPSYPQAYFVRGSVYYTRKEYDKALADATKTIRLNSKFAPAYAGRAWVYFRMGQLQRGLSDAEKALKLEPGSKEALEIRGYLLLGLSRTDEALADFSIAIELGLNEPVTFYGRGRAYELKENRNQALADYRKALSLPADSPDKRWAQTEARAGIARLLKPLAVVAKREEQSPIRQPPTVGPQRRIALIIGNARYKHVQQLTNPDRDARAVAAALRRLGFAEVVERHDLDANALRGELKRFGDKALQADWAVIYFAGHGLQVDGKSYLIPVDAALKRVSHIDDEAIDVQRVLDKVSYAKKLRLVILDACRDNPFVPQMKQVANTTRSINRGLARVEPSGGALVAYAARDGQVANDGNLGHSPYTAALLRHLEEPGLELSFLFRRIRGDVLKETNGKQEPVIYGALPDDRFYFRGPGK